MRFVVLREGEAGSQVLLEEGSLLLVCLKILHDGRIDGFLQVLTFLGDFLLLNTT